METKSFLDPSFFSSCPSSMLFFLNILLFDRKIEKYSKCITWTVKEGFVCGSRKVERKGERRPGSLIFFVLPLLYAILFKYFTLRSKDRNVFQMYNMDSKRRIRLWIEKSGKEGGEASWILHFFVLLSLCYSF